MFDEEIIELQVEGLHTQAEVLSYLGQRLREKGVVKESFVEAVCAREKIYPTGLQLVDYGVAIPHTDVEHVHKAQIAIMTLTEPVTFTQMASNDITVQADIIIMLAIKEAHSQVDILQKLMSFIQDSETMLALKHADKKDKKAILEKIQKAIF